MNTPAVPAVHPRLAIVLRLRLSESELGQDHQLETRLYAEDGEQVAQGAGPFHAVPRPAVMPPGGQVSAGAVINFENLVFPRFGPYSIAILWDGLEVPRRLLLDVRQPGA